LGSSSNFSSIESDGCWCSDWEKCCNCLWEDEELSLSSALVSSELDRSGTKDHELTVSETGGESSGDIVGVVWELVEPGGSLVVSG
jgi:hypothetical protein